MPRRTLMLAALSLVMFTKAAVSAEANPATLPATRPTTQPGAPPDKAKLIAAIRNDDLLWEMEFPTERHRGFWWIGPHYSPRPQKGSAVYTLIPYPPPIVGQGGLVENAEEPPPLPFRFREVAEPLVKAMEDPDRWFAAHVILVHLTLRGEPTWEESRRLKGGLKFPGPKGLQGSGAWLLNLDDRKDLPKLPNGAYEETFAGVRVELLPEGPARFFVLDGTPGGEWQVRKCSAKIDPEQRERFHKWWVDHLKLLAAADAAQTPPTTRP